ncbi:MAG TPA: 2-hydroxyacyl-CoA dehydratase, partial [Proteobacteria bacterium]|nr:2-hydroxyacyl-CoA dehydratase [Pseudomonadota bacterium]
EMRLEAFLASGESVVSWESRPKLGLLGVPPILDDLIATFERMGAHIAYLEVPQQFAMIGNAENLAQQYARYTYPYGMNYRLREIVREMRRRGLVGLVHYVQSFCHRQIEDIVLREKVDIPVLTIEADEPASVGENLRIRIEAFLEMLGT